MSLPAQTLRIMALGDVVGAPGRAALTEKCRALREERQIDLVIANGENSAGGFGLSPSCAEEIYAAGVDVITLGDHTWQRSEIKEFLQENRSRCIRPANYPRGAPGSGYAVWTGRAGYSVGIMNLLGRVFMNGALDCPFREVEHLLTTHLKDCSAVICDLHAEATSEKIAMARFLDGRVSLLFGTHTHVQTADEQILPKGMAYISDLGMCGPRDGVLGMKAELSIKRFTTGMRVAYGVEKGPTLICGVICEIDLASKKATSVERIQVGAGS